MKSEALALKYAELPEDARFYIECIGSHDEIRALAVSAHAQVCLTCPPSPDRDVEAIMDNNAPDDYLRLFVDTYCAMETLHFAETMAVN